MAILRDKDRWDNQGGRCVASFVAGGQAYVAEYIRGVITFSPLKEPDRFVLRNDETVGRDLFPNSLEVTRSPWGTALVTVGGWTPGTPNSRHIVVDTGFPM